MSKKETIEDRVKSLQEQEEKIKLQIDADSEELKSKGMRVAKIALVSGLVAIGGYLIFNLFFGDDEEEKPEKKSASGNGFFARIGALAVPYLEKSLDGLLNDETEKKDTDKD